MGKFSRAVQALQDRLEYHAQAGRILEGFRISTEMTKETFGKADMPLVIIFLPTMTEENSGRLLQLSIRLNMVVHVWNDLAAKDLVEALEKVADALTTAHDGSGRPDNGLAGSGFGSGHIEYGNYSALANSLSAELTIVLKARASEFAERRT